VSISRGWAEEVVRWINPRIIQEGGRKLVNRKYLSNQPGLISEVDKMGCCWLPAAVS